MSVKKNLFGIAKSISMVVALTTGVATVTAVMSPVAMAAAEKGQKLSSKMKPLGEAQKLMGEKKFKEALAIINDQVVPIQGKTPYEDSVTNEMKAYCLISLRDQVGAAKVYETMLAANQVSADQVASKTMLIAEIYLNAGDYAKAAQFYERILKDSPNDAQALNGITLASYKKGDYKATIEYCQKQIKLAEQARKPVDKTLLVMQRFSYFKTENNAGLAAVTEQLLELYPAPEYWADMFKVLKSEGTGFNDKEQLEIFRLKKAVGAMAAEDYNSMAELALSMLDAGDAKSVIEAGINSGVTPVTPRITKLLDRAKADAAQDLASLDATAKEAANKPNGEALAKVGLAYLGHGLNDKAASALQSAIAKGDLTSLDLAYIRLGAANLNQGKKAEAIKAFQSVSDKSKLARLAKMWIIFAKK